MKTKLLSMLLAAALLAALSACGGSNAGEGQPSAGNGAPGSAPAMDAPPQSDEAPGPFKGSASLIETVMVDEDGVKITATGLTYSSYSAELELTIENNSGKDLSFVSGSAGYSCNSINGYMVSGGYLNCDVASGKKANDSIDFSYDTLMLYGIDEIADLEIGFSITDEESNTTHTGPRQVKTSAFDTHDYSTDHFQAAITSQAVMNTYGYAVRCFTRDTLYDQSGVTLRSAGILAKQDGETALLLELENATDSMVYLSTSDIALNGLLLESSIWSNDAINPGKRCIVDVTLSSILDPACLEVYGVTEIRSVSLNLGLRSEDGMELAPEGAVEIVMTEGGTPLDTAGTELYNKNGLRIVAKAILEDPADYSADLNVLLLAENNSGRTLTIDDVYNSLSVNGFMTDYLFYSQELADGASAALIIDLRESSMEENQIASPADVQEIEVKFEIRDGYTSIDEPTCTLTFGA